MNKLEDYSPVSLSHHLLREHAVDGGFRDEADLNLSRFHSRITLEICIDFIKNIEGTTEDKIKFFETSKKELNKFTTK